MYQLNFCCKHGQRGEKQDSRHRQPVPHDQASLSAPDSGLAVEHTYGTQSNSTRAELDIHLAKPARDLRSEKIAGMS